MPDYLWNANRLLAEPLQKTEQLAAETILAYLHGYSFRNFSTDPTPPPSRTHVHHPHPPYPPYHHPVPPPIGTPLPPCPRAWCTSSVTQPPMCPWPNPCPIAVIRGRKSPFDTDTRFRGLFSNYQRPSTWRNCLIKAPMRRYLRGLYYPFIMLRRNLWRSTSSEIEEATLLAVAAIAAERCVCVRVCARPADGCVARATGKITPMRDTQPCYDNLLTDLSFGSIIIINSLQM